MKQSTRERLALLIFVALLAFAAAVLLSYFSTGRSWNVAATYVDDAAGSMEDYTALVYAGVVEPPRTQASAEGRPSGAGAAEGEGGLFASDVRSAYESKDARCVTLDLARASRYAEPLVLYAGERAVGVFSVDTYTTRAQLERIVALLEERGAENVVCITPRTYLLAGYEGIDAVIVTTDAEGYSSNGAFEGRTFSVRSPEKGRIGVLVFNASNVPSVKEIHLR